MVRFAGWLGSLSTATASSVSVAAAVTCVRSALSVDPALAWTRPTPDATENFAVELTAHEPPMSAAPHPAATFLPNASAASTAGPAVRGDTDRVVCAVRP